MWYYKSFQTIKNLHKILIFLILNYVQKNLKITFSNYSVSNGSNLDNIKNFYYFEDLTICNSENKYECNCLILIDNYKLKYVFKNIRYFKRIRIIDINFFGHLGINTLINIGYYDLKNEDEKKAVIQKSFLNLNLLQRDLDKQTVFVLGNNEKHSEIINEINSNPIFICNDAIKNINNIDTKTLIVAFSDPLFHFSNSDNAKSFLNFVKELENKIDYIIIPLQAIPILLKMNFKTKLIGLSSRRNLKNIVSIENNEIFTKNTHNVLTQYMLPIAAQYSKKVNLSAITLSDKNIAESLWQYDKKLVPKNSKSFAFKYSFFKDRNFNKYYRLHQKHLNRILESNKNINIL